ncbi:MAG: AAA family ATPase [Clostridia bacterium]|jgi:shikimate kinase|nr:AAA family ATPase [Clostridia bacterium]
MNIVLTGFMGTGKSKIGKRLAERLGMSYLDTDELIEEREKDSVPAIFKKRGEEYFRRLETKVVKEVALLDNFVISTGGGVVLREGNIRLLKKNALIVCLFASPEVILKRTKGDDNRPLLGVNNQKKRIEELLALRKPYYEKADFRVDTSALDSEGVVEEIIEFLEKEEISRRTKLAQNDNR